MSYIRYFMYIEHNHRADNLPETD